MCAGVKQKNGSSRRVLLLERPLPLGRQTTGEGLCLTPLTLSPGSGNRILSNQYARELAEVRCCVKKELQLIAALDVIQQLWLAVTKIETRKGWDGAGMKGKRKTGAFSPEILRRLFAFSQFREN